MTGTFLWTYVIAILCSPGAYFVIEVVNFYTYPTIGSPFSFMYDILDSLGQGDSYRRQDIRYWTQQSASDMEVGKVQEIKYEKARCNYYSTYFALVFIQQVLSWLPYWIYAALYYLLSDIVKGSITRFPPDAIEDGLDMVAGDATKSINVDQGGDSPGRSRSVEPQEEFLTVKTREEVSQLYHGALEMIEARKNDVQSGLTADSIRVSHTSSEADGTNNYSKT